MSGRRAGLLLLVVVVAAATVMGGVLAPRASAIPAPPPPPGATSPPGPASTFYFNAYGPSPNDDVLLRWDQETLNAIRAGPAGPRGRCARVGDRAHQAVLDYRHHDGSNQLGDLNAGAPYSDYTGFTPVNSWNQVNDIYQWQPLCVPLPPPGATSCPSTSTIQRFSTPQWGRVTPFALTRPDQFGPPAMDRSWLPAEAQALVDLQVKMNDANKASASYWADGAGTETLLGRRQQGVHPTGPRR